MIFVIDFLLPLVVVEPSSVCVRMPSDADTNQCHPPAWCFRRPEDSAGLEEGILKGYELPDNCRPLLDVLIRAAMGTGGRKGPAANNYSRKGHWEAAFCGSVDAEVAMFMTIAALLGLRNAKCGGKRASYDQAGPRRKPDISANEDRARK